MALKIQISAFLSFILCLSLALASPSQRTTDEDEWSEGLYEWIENHNVLESDAGGFTRFMSSEEPPIVNFMLYTKEHPDKYTLVSVDDPESLKNVDPSKELKIVIHGWRNNYESKFGTTIKNAYLENKDVNVIVVDWSSISYNNYISSRMSVPKVAEIVAELIEVLVKRGHKLDMMHLIGHSLGAHVSGIAGLRLKSGMIARVTGLDPAGPMFDANEDDVLKPESAKFVDVIHTCGYMLGFLAPLGHVDFYPNKGTISQPGCGFDYKGTCSHSRAYIFFAESIASNEMLAVKCDDPSAFDDYNCSSESAVPMGEHVPHTARGLYFLRTNKVTPFARGVAY